MCQTRVQKLWNPLGSLGSVQTGVIGKSNVGESLDVTLFFTSLSKHFIMMGVSARDGSR